VTSPVQAALASHVPASYSLAVALLGPGPAAEDAVRAAVGEVTRDRVPAARAAGRLLAQTRQTARRTLCRSERTEPEPERRRRALTPLQPRPGADNAVVLAVGELPKQERLALQLAYFGCYTFAEIAALTGLPVGTVRRLVTSAARTLIAANDTRR
jgi:RNA polymerase sigma-70 factor (ECF subfamily)